MGPLLVFVCASDGYTCTARDKGALLGAFSLGYVSTQIVGGVLADRLGPRLVISGAILIAGVACFATPDGGRLGGLSGLWTITVALGLAQGPLFPTSIAYLARWLPPSQRSFASTMLDSGITVGSLIAMPCSGFLAETFGWQNTFRIYGAATLAFLVVFFRWSADSPDACPFITDEEKQYLAGEVGGGSNSKTNGKDDGDTNSSAANAKEGGGGIGSQLAVLLGHAAVWALFLSHIAFNFSVYFLNSWSPLFYAEALGLGPAEAAGHFMAPHLANLVVKLFISKPLFFFLQNSAGFSLLHCRRFFSVVGFLGTAAALAGLAKAYWMAMALKASEDGGDASGEKAIALYTTTACFTVAMAFVALHPSGFKANYMDLTRHSSGLLSGLGNTLASVGAYVGPMAIGGVLERYDNDWSLAFAMVGAVSAASAATYAMLSSADPVDVPATAEGNTSAADAGAAGGDRPVSPKGMKEN
eukprot:g4613.t1